MWISDRVIQAGVWFYELAILDDHGGIDKHCFQVGRVEYGYSLIHIEVLELFDPIPDQNHRQFQDIKQKVAEIFGGSGSVGNVR